MIFKETELDKVLVAIQEQPHKFIRLVDKDGKVIIPFQNAKGDRVDHWNRFFIAFLTSENTAQGLYSIEGKHTGKSSFLVLAQVDKKNGSQVAPVSQVSNVPNGIKYNANLDFIEDNAELRSQLAILQYQLRDKENYISQLEEQIEELNKTIEELNQEEEEEEEKKPMLSENAQMLMELAKPFIPLAQGIAMNLLSKYMPQPQEPQQQQTETYGSEV